MIITYEKAVVKDVYCIIEGENLDALQTTNVKVQNIKEKMPMNFSKISSILIEEIGYLGYIDFWKNMKIIKQKI